MDLKKVISFSGLIAGLAFIYLGVWGLEQELWSKLFTALQDSMGISSSYDLAWSQSLFILGVGISLGSLILYFFRKNLSSGRYSGIFVLYLIIILFITSWLISHSLK